jgi:hypothetical protein
MKLSLVCVTQAAPALRPTLGELADLATLLGAEMVWGAHGPEAQAYLSREPNVVPVVGEYLEQMLDQVFAKTTGQYILRMDDDERCSSQMIAWLRSEEYLTFDCWGFYRVHLWPDERTIIASLFSDVQCRLATRTKSSRPAVLHMGSQWPTKIVPVAIEHYNFLLKTRAERLAIGNKYARLQGRPESQGVFPEDAHEPQVLWPYPGPWPPEELRWHPADVPKKASVDG